MKRKHWGVVVKGHGREGSDHKISLDRPLECLQGIVHTDGHEQGQEKSQRKDY